jgi:hypothetical protein
MPCRAATTATPRCRARRCWWRASARARRWRRRWRRPMPRTNCSTSCAGAWRLPTQSPEAAAARLARCSAAPRSHPTRRGQPRPPVRQRHLPAHHVRQRQDHPQRSRVLRRRHRIHPGGRRALGPAARLRLLQRQLRRVQGARRLRRGLEAPASTTMCSRAREADGLHAHLLQHGRDRRGARGRRGAHGRRSAAAGHPRPDPQAGAEGDDLLLLHVQTPRTQTLRFMAGQRAR